MVGRRQGRDESDRREASFDAVRPQEEIIEALVRSAELDAKNITVEVDGGRVTPEGACRGRGEEAARQAWAAQALFPWITHPPSCRPSHEHMTVKRR